MDNENLYVNQRTISEIIDISQPEIVKLVRKGFPCIKDEKSQKQTKYPIKECVHWYLKYKTAKDFEKDTEKQARIRKLILESDRIELELAERKKELINITIISSVWEKVLGEFKMRLNNIPKKITSIYDSIRDQNDLETFLSDEIFQALDELSRADSLLESISEQNE